MLKSSKDLVEEDQQTLPGLLIVSNLFWLLQISLMFQFSMIPWLSLLLNIAYVGHGIYLCCDLIRYCFFGTQQSASMEPTVSEATYDTIVAQGTELVTLNNGHRVNLGYLIYPRDEHVVNGTVEPRLFPIPYPEVRREQIRKTKYYVL